MTVNEKIAALRSAMKAKNIDAYLIPSSDPHQSEYVADHWKSRAWISGFTGSAGTVIVTQEIAHVWVDSRYFIQGEAQLKGTDFDLQKQKIAHAPEHILWMKNNLKEGAKLAFDGRLFSVGQVQQLTSNLTERGIKLDGSHDLISEIWKDRPSLPQDLIFDHDVKYAGQDRAEKLKNVRSKMEKKGTDFYFISTLDDIAWMFNLRGNDVECNPVFYSYAIISRDEAYLFIEPSKVSDELKSKLNGDGILIKKYDEIEDFLKKLPQGKTIQIDASTINNYLFQTIPSDQIVKGQNIVRCQKAIKNPIEVGHIREAMIKDGVALTKLFRWLDSTLDERPVPETEVAEKLIEFRRAQGDYHGESFDAICGYKGNGAIVHYRAESESCANIEKDGILLLDSGGQYTNGTTDITRTITLGNPTNEQKRNFTLVLKGHIGLTLAKFPERTTGVQLDTLARINLWKHNLNYGHGTGHGVGFFLNVHEPPQGFATNPGTSRGTTFISPGMFTSNEPGYYKTDEYGIRIENLILCVMDREVDDTKWYKFETLTLFPIDLNLIDKSLLSSEEQNWLNEYHQEVYKKLSPHLDEKETDWMKKMCRAI